MKTYYRYESSDFPLGIISSRTSNIIYLNDIKIEGGKKTYKSCIISGGLENVFIWDSRKGEKVLTLVGTDGEVSYLCFCRETNTVFAGYTNGNIRMWKLEEIDSPVSFNGHTSKVTTLDYNSECTRLVSGAMDNFVIVWDLVNECGLYKLKGHNGPITKCQFMKSVNVLISSSQDTLIKLWDLESQHCFATLVGHESETWSFVLFENETGLVAGTSGDELKVWKLDHQTNNIDHMIVAADFKRSIDTSIDNYSIDKNIPIKCYLAGSIIKSRKGLTRSLRIDSSQTYIFCQNKKGSIEIIKINHSKDVKRVEQLDSEKEHFDVSFNEKLQSIGVLDFDDKISSFDFTSTGSGSIISLCVALKNNTLQNYNLNISDNKVINKLVNSITYSGHRSEPRVISFSSDNNYFFSGSSESIMIWSLHTRKCLRNIPSEYCTGLLFVPGNRYLIASTKSGALCIYDVSSGLLLDRIDGHSGPIWALSPMPNNNGFASCSSDHSVKFWDYETLDTASFGKRLNLSHSRTLEMDEDVLYVCFSPNQKFVAVALIDSNVKIFYEDTLKYYLTLYGHKLPINCLDISSDNILIATASRDKNVKLWGLDFGDCHKSIFSHQKSVTCIKFVHATHYYFTSGMDGIIKYWDGDNFSMLLELKGHHSGINSFAISCDGDFIVSVSSDQSIRIWEKTNELFIPSYEEEQRMEQEVETNLSTIHKPMVSQIEDEVQVPWLSTIETVKRSEDLIEAIELMEEEKQRIESFKLEYLNDPSKQFVPHPILKNLKMEPQTYVMYVLSKTPSSYIEESLMTLPYKYVLKFIPLILHSLKNAYEIELCCRCLIFLLKLHFYQLSYTESLKALIDDLGETSKQQLILIKDTLGMNLASLRHLKNKYESTNNVNIYDELLSKKNKNRKKTKSIKK